jgi:hypothetical protein
MPALKICLQVTTISTFQWLYALWLYHFGRYQSEKKVIEQIMDLDAKPEGRYPTMPSTPPRIHCWGPNLYISADWVGFLGAIDHRLGVICAVLDKSET